MIIATITILAPLALVVYLVLAWRIKRVTYLPDGTRITWYPLMPGTWVEEGVATGRCRTREEHLDREDTVATHIERCRQIAKANRRQIRAERGGKPAALPLGKRVNRFTERAAKATHSALR